MANPFTKLANKITMSLQEMFNQSFDSDFNQNTTELIGYDSTNSVLRRVTVGPTGSIRHPQYDLLIDYSGGTNPIYVGYAEPGISSSVASWMITKFTWDANNNPTAKQYAGGSSNFVNIWDNRASLTYT